MTIPKRTLLALPLGLVAALTCAEPDVIVVEGERIDIHHAEDFMLCGGTVDSFDRGIDFVAEQLELDPTTFNPFTYTWLGREAFMEVSPAISRSKGAWAFGDQSYAQFPDLFHEVIHLISHQEKVNAITFFTEGLATAFEDFGDIHTRWSGQGGLFREDPRPTLGARYGEINYNIASAFVSYLLARFGPALFWELNHDLGFFSNDDQFHRRFERVYGVDLDDVVEDYLSEESCTEDMRHIPMPTSCAAPEVAWQSDDLWGYARIIDCRDDDVVGGWGERSNKSSVAVTIRVQDPGVYDVRVLSDLDARGVLRRCGGCPWLDPTYNADAEYQAVALEAGVYSLTLHARASDSPPIVAALRRLPEGTPPAPVW